jgi:hypothetical protein
MNASTASVTAQPTTRASALITSPTPPSRMLARATLLASPLDWDEAEESGPSALWHGGGSLHSESGPIRAGDLLIWWRQVAAGPDYAVARVMGLNIGRITVRSLTVTCIGGLTAVEVDGTADGQQLHPGFRGHTGMFEVEVASSTRERDGSCTVTGLSIATAGSPVLRIAVVNVGRQSIPDETRPRP